MNFTSPIFWIVLFFIYLIWITIFCEKGKKERFYLLGSSLLIYSIYFPFHAINIISVTYLTYKLSSLNGVNFRYIAIAINILHLLFYKYNQLFFPTSYLNVAPRFEMLIPVGISFYTFQNLSYIFDLSRKQSKCCKCFTDYLLYISFFPQLVAGPIVRYSYFIKQLNNRRKMNFKKFVVGCERIIYGLFLKLVIANNLAFFVDQNWDKAYYIENGADWPLFLILAFSFQIFADFSGYSLIAIGIALLFGIVLPQNFRAPYISLSLSEFWQRWHRTLSRWIKDYLYIPFGGNLLKGWHMIFVLVVIMGLSGFWHGNTLSFGLWGILHGLALAFERFVVSKYKSRISVSCFKKYVSFIRFTYCFGVVAFTWIFFREQNTYFSLLFIRSLFFGEWSSSRLSEITVNNPMFLYSLMIILVIHTFAFMRQRRSLKSLSIENRIYLCAFCIINCIYLYGSDASFIYFRF